jgi:hypothetical protein
MVRFFFAALAAFLIFFLAADFCFALAISPHRIGIQRIKVGWKTLEESCSHFPCQERFSRIFRSESICDPSRVISAVRDWL